ncbi:hypothetical protein B0H17DRAFT_1204604 [Mycena rosella]|uniref:DUF7025 domain-containing protein n=1 Tax=Mycena rosella TaxID=1033263 RepID=A0AAD7D8Y7_MYCRO|nr:hypothetical protein B0H17DRAFT_1204604 [Mycena rosella]
MPEMPEGTVSNTRSSIPLASWGHESNGSDDTLDPEIFLTFLHIFIAYRDALAERKHKSEQEAAAALVAKILSSVNLLIFFLSADYRSTIATVEHLTAHREITFDLLYAIFIPRTLVVARCAVTGLECIFQLQQAMHTCQGEGRRSARRTSLEMSDAMNEFTAQFEEMKDAEA